MLIRGIILLKPDFQRSFLGMEQNSAYRESQSFRQTASLFSVFSPFCIAYIMGTAQSLSSYYSIVDKASSSGHLQEKF